MLYVYYINLLEQICIYRNFLIKDYLGSNNACKPFQIHCGVMQIFSSQDLQNSSGKMLHGLQDMDSLPLNAWQAWNFLFLTRYRATGDQKQRRWFLDQTGTVMQTPCFRDFTEGTQHLDCTEGTAVKIVLTKEHSESILKTVLRAQHLDCIKGIRFKTVLRAQH